MAIPGLGRGMTAEQILGMSTDDFKAKMDGAAAKADVTDLSAKVDEQKSTLDEIRTILAGLTQKPAVVDPQIVADADDPTTSMLADPQGFVSRQTMGIQATALAAKSDVQEMRARQENPGAFAKFGRELMETAKSFPVHMRAADNFWQQHIASFIGNKAMRGELDAGSYPSLLGGSTIAAQGSMGGDVTDPNRGFTPDQIAYFKERNIPLAKAAAYRDLMHRDGEPIDIQKYKERVDNAA